MLGDHEFLGADEQHAQLHRGIFGNLFDLPQRELRREPHARGAELAGDGQGEPVGDGHVGNDGFANVGLPDAHHAGAAARAIARDTAGIDQPGVDGKRARRGGQVAAVAAPVHKVGVDGHLPVEVVHGVIGARAFREDHALAGAGGGAAHAVDVGAVGVGAADDALKQPVARAARHLAALRQVLQAKEHALAGAAPDVGGGNAKLGLWHKD